MSEPMIKKLSSNEFNVEKFVKDLSQHCVGGLELQQKRVEIGALAEETNSLLKKNVFHNYMLFIETAKEISHLEGEMYQLSHLLTEQRSLLSSLAHISIVEGGANVSVNNPEVDKEVLEKKQLTEIMQKVDGCVTLLESPSRHLVFEGDVVELDALENKPIRRIHAYLLSDMLILASQHPSTPSKYKLNTCYELTSLAVVNIRHIPSGFKLLAFPDTRVFQAPSAVIKKEWLDKFDELKKSSKVPEQRSIIKSESVESSDSTNPFEEEEEDDEDAGSYIPDWLNEVPEDLDVLIVQRHFEEAYNLIEKTREYFDTPGHGLDPVFVQEINRKLTSRVESLTIMLTKELEVTPEKSLQGGLRAARRSIKVLNKLDKSTLACDLFLKICSSIMKIQMKRVKRDGATLTYVKTVSSVFFSNLTSMTNELQVRAFPNNGQCSAAYVVWATQQFNLFISHMIKELFVTQSSLSTLSQCISAIAIQCDQLTTLGLDLRYLLDGAFRGPLTKALKETKDKMADTIKLRCNEDKWKPYNLNNRQQRDKLLNEFSEAGLSNMSSYLTGDCWLRLSNNTILFTRLYLTLLEDCINLATNDLLYDVDETLYVLIHVQLKHVDASLRSDKFVEEREFIVQNADFIINNLLTLCEKKFENHFKFKSKKLMQARNEFKHLA